MVDLRGPSEIANPAWGPGTNFRPGNSLWTRKIPKTLVILSTLITIGGLCLLRWIKIKLTNTSSGGHISNLDGTVSGFWENDLPGANYQGDNRSLTISADGSSSTATGAYKHEYEAESSNDYYHHVMHFLGRGPSNDAPPYTEKQDSVDVYFVVNMSNVKDYTGQQVHMAGDLESEVTGGNDWSHGIKMKDIGNGYWAYHWRGIASDGNPDTLNYKFTLGDWSGTHEDGLKGRCSKCGNRQVIVDVERWNEDGDATVPVWYNNNPPSPFTSDGRTLS